MSSVQSKQPASALASLLMIANTRRRLVAALKTAAAQQSIAAQQNQCRHMSMFSKVTNFFKPTMLQQSEYDDVLNNRVFPQHGNFCILGFGDGRNGRTGLNNTQQTVVPMPVVTNSEIQRVGIKQISAGAGHWLLLLSNGHVYACGANAAGQLGLGDDNGDALSPIHITKLANEEIVHVDAGWTTSAAVTADGKLYTWGFQKTSMVDKNTLMGSVSPLGHGSSSASSNVPKLVEALKGEHITQASLGEKHTGCISKDGKVWTFGTGNWGRLGHGDSRNYVQPTLVEGLPERITQISLGKGFTHLLTEKGRIYVFGKSENNSLGMDTTSILGANNLDGEPAPILLDVLADVRMKYVDCGGSYTTAMDHSGNAYIWGKNYFVAEQVSRVKNVAHCAAGINHAGFVDAKGRVFMTGSSSEGQLGHKGGTMASLNEIHEVPSKFFPGKVVSLHCGDRYTLAVVQYDQEQNIKRAQGNEQTEVKRQESKDDSSSA